jgi:transcription elongation factor Elf1
MLKTFFQWLADRLRRQPKGDATMSDGSGSTQCPHCGAVGTYKITIQQGGQVISCNNCRKNFTAQVDHAKFIGKNR